MLREEVALRLALCLAPCFAPLAGCSPSPSSVPPTVVLLSTADPLPSASSEGAPADVGAPRTKDLAPIAWADSEPAARERARRTGLPLIVWVRASWDVSTLEMERKVWTDPAVIAAARPFVTLRLDVTDTDGDAERYAERYEVKGVPTVVLFGPGGRRVEALVGFRDPAVLAAALRAAAAE